MLHVINFAVLSNDGEAEFERWQREIIKAEIEAGQLKNGSLSSSVGGDIDIDDRSGVPSPPDGEEEFTDDDGTTYKWDRSLRVWVPQVGCEFFNFQFLLFLEYHVSSRITAKALFWILCLCNMFFAFMY